MELDEIEELDSCFHEQIGPAFLFFLQYESGVQNSTTSQSVFFWSIRSIHIRCFFNTNQHSNTIWNKQKATKTVEILKLKT